MGIDRSLQDAEVNNLVECVYNFVTHFACSSYNPPAAQQDGKQDDVGYSKTEKQ
jgi:hypothetical protein